MERKQKLVTGAREDCRVKLRTEASILDDKIQVEEVQLFERTKVEGWRF